MATQESKNNKLYNQISNLLFSISNCAALFSLIAPLHYGSQLAATVMTEFELCRLLVCYY